MRIDRSKGSRGKWAILTAAAVAGLVSSRSALASDFLWDGGGADFNWETATNWNPDGTPNSFSDTITFDNTGTFTSAISLGAAKSIGAVYATGGQVITVGTSGQQLSLADGGTISRTAGSGWLLIGADLSLAGNATFNASGGGLVLIDGGISGGGGINITGDSSSYVYLRGNNSGYSGQITLSSGNAVFTSQAVFGSNTTTVVQGGRIVMGGGTITQNFDINQNASLSNTSSGGTYTGVWTIAAGKTLSVDTGGGNGTNLSMVFAGSGDISVAQAISPIGPLVINGASNTNTGVFTIVSGPVHFQKTGDVVGAGGTLRVASTGIAVWDANDQLNNVANVNMAGGTLKPSGFSDTAGVMTLSGNSTIDFNGGSSVLVFADSSGATWTAATKLTLTNYGADGTDALTFGISNTALTAGQLAQLRFLNPTGYAAGTYSASLDLSGNVTVGSLVVLASSWTNTGDGNWTDDVNWDSGAPITPDATATFGTAGSNPHVVTLGSNLSVKSVTFDSASSYTVSGAGTLTIVDANPLTVTTGSHTFSTPVVLSATNNLSIGAGTLTFGTLSVSGSSFTNSSTGNVVIGNLPTATAVTVSGTGNTTFGTLASGLTTLTIGGTGNTTINASNSFNATVNVLQGAGLLLGSDTALGSTTSLTIGSDGVASGPFGRIGGSGAGTRTVSQNLSFVNLEVTGSQDITFTGAMTQGTDGSGNHGALKISNTGLTKFTGNFSNTAAYVLHLRGTGNVEFDGSFTTNASNRLWEVGNTGVGGVAGTYTGIATFVGANNAASNFIAGAAGNPGGGNNGITIAVGGDSAFIASTNPPSGAVNNIMIINSGVTLIASGGTHTIGRSDSRMFDVTFGGSQVLDFATANGLRVAGASGDLARTWNFTNTARVRSNALGQNTNPTALTMTGTGIWEIYGTTASNFSAKVLNTTINGGTLLANNTNTAGALGSTAIVVGSGGTLGGTGRVGSGSLTVGGTISPGDTTGTGTLDHNGAITFNSGSRLKIQLAGTTPGDNAGNGNYDQFNDISAASAVSNTGNLTLEVSTLAGFSTTIGDVYYILTRADGASTAPFSGLAEGASVPIGDALATITYQANWNVNQAGSSFTGGNDVALLVTVPEPSTASLLMLGAAAMLGKRRRRNI